MTVDQEEIHRLSLSEKTYDKLQAAFKMKIRFESLSDKSNAFDDLHRLTSDEYSIIRREAALTLDSVFNYIPEEYKATAFDDLHRLTNDKNSDVREMAAAALGSAFEYIPNKSAAWADLDKLTSDENLHVRREAVYALDNVFYHIPEKHMAAAFDDLHRLINDEDLYIRRNATHGLSNAFDLIPEKYKTIAFDDLRRLTNDKDSKVRSWAANSISFTFEYAPDKSAAWDDLHRLINDENWDVRDEAATAIGGAFPFIPEEHKSVAFEDLRRLTDEKGLFVRGVAALAIGHAFRYIPEEHKTVAWDDLDRLTSDEDSNIRLYANYSLGKICIYKASKSKNKKDTRIQLEEAIRYFKIAAIEHNYYNPAKFCYSFYRSFDAVLFKKVNAKKEIDGYIDAAKKEIKESEIKEKLIKAIEKLAEALEKVHNASRSDVDWQEALRQSSEILDYVDKLMKENRDKTPVIYDLYEIAIPSFEEAIKKRINDIKKQADIACKVAKEEYKPFACGIKQSLNNLNEDIYLDPVKLNSKLNSILGLANGKILFLPDLADMSEMIEKALRSSNSDQKTDVIYEILKRLPQKTSDSDSEKMIKAIGVGAAVFGVIIVLSPNDPIPAVIFGLLITFFTFYLL